MGYGFPASIGVQMAHRDALVINVAGEASWLMNMQELGTAVQFRLPVKQFILNNERLGMVRQWQELLHGERYSHSWSEALPDFVKLAEAFGAKGIGEPGCVPTAPAVANAIYDAVGVRIKDLPITPESVLAAIREKKGLDLCGQEAGKDDAEECVIEE